jgi:hypothetical protein
MLIDIALGADLSTLARLSVISERGAGSTVASVAIVGAASRRYLLSSHGHSRRSGCHL